MTLVPTRTVPYRNQPSALHSRLAGLREQLRSLIEEITDVRTQLDSEPQTPRKFKRMLRLGFFLGLGLGAAAIPVMVAVSGTTCLHDAQTETGGTLHQVAQAAALYFLATENCPSNSALVRDGYLDRERKDGWGRNFEIICDGEGVAIVSAGEDGTLCTSDDLQDAFTETQRRFSCSYHFSPSLGDRRASNTQ